MTPDQLRRAHDHVLVFGLAGILVLVGVAKLVDPVAWVGYLPGWARTLSPVPATTAMHLTSVLEIGLGAGIAVDAGRRPYWAGATTLWLLSITVAVASIGAVDIALRDLGLTLWAAAVTLHTLVRCTELG